jgi:acyl-CoA synthetase (NDP forming)
VYGAVILSAGFAETGPDGAALEGEVLRIARTWGVRVVGPNGLGIINTHPGVQLHATFAPVAPRRGRTALLSESGMIGAAIVGSAREAGLGLSSMVALGNRADVSGNDLLQYWETDPDTDVVCMYIESFGNPRRFSRRARRLTRAKPVVAVKAAGGGATGEALLRQTGVIRVPTLMTMLDTTRMLVEQPLPAGRRVAVVGNAGGSLAIATDAVLDAGLEVAAVVDLGLHASRHEIEAEVARHGADPAVDALLMLYAPSLGATAIEARDALESGQKAHPELAVSACFYGPLPPLGGDAEPGRVPVYAAVDAAARVIGHAADYAEWLSLPEGTIRDLGLDAAVAARALVAERLVQGGPTTLPTLDAAPLLATVGLEVLGGEQAGTHGEARAAADRMGYPVVLKAARREPTAKSAAAGFAIDLERDALPGAWARMDEGLGDGMLPVLVQPMIDPGIDVAVRVLLDDQVGPVLAIGPGGAGAALDHAVEVQVLPVSDLDAERLIARSRLADVLDEGARRALREVLERVGALVEILPEVTALELNPVILCRGEAVLAQAMVGLTPVESDPLPPIRRV